MPTLAILGCGYVARIALGPLHAAGWHTLGTHRSPPGTAALDSAESSERHQTVLFDGIHPLSPTALSAVDALLCSIPPDAAGDPFLRCHPDLAERAPRLRWLGYFSSTAVYGDQDGAWVDETTPITPQSAQGIARARAEAQWQDMAQGLGVSLTLFRVAGIYGPQRNMVARLRANQPLPPRKMGAFVSRIHVADMVDALLATLPNPNSAQGAPTNTLRILNLADNEPAPTTDVAAFAAALLGVASATEPTPDGPEFRGLVTSLSENRRVSNQALRRLLGRDLRYPTFREGLRQCLLEDKLEDKP